MSKDTPLPEGARRGITRRLRKLARAALAALSVSLAVIGAATSAAHAQEATTPQAGAQDSGGLGHPQIFITPYLWLPGVYATTATPLARASEVNSSVGPFELLGKLEGAPLMGSAEIRDGPIGLLGDIVHGPFGSNITTRNVFYQGGHAALNTNIGTALIIYRVLGAPNQFADLGVGFRSWGVDANLSLNPGLLQGEKVYRRAGWGDPLIGGRYHFDFNNGIGLSAYGDVGGFDLGAHTDWQMMGTVDYALNSWINLHVGYRSLNINYTSSSGNLGFDIHMRGPIFAGTFRF